MDDYYDSPITVWRTVATKFEDDVVNEIVSIYAAGYESAKNETTTIPKEEN